MNKKLIAPTAGKAPGLPKNGHGAGLAIDEGGAV